MNTEVDTLVARYKALEDRMYALDGPAVEAELDAISGQMAETCDAILDALLGPTPGGSGRQAA